MRQEADLEPGKNAPPREERLSRVQGSETHATAARNVLLVDADPQINSLVLKILEPSWGIQHVPNNVAARALAKTRAFDLIVTSQKTSGKEDVELLRKIRSVRPHTRLIILAGESTPADVVASMRERAFSYFSAPFSMDSLAEIIRRATEEDCWDDGIEVTSATPEWIQIEARCDLKTADRLVQFFHEISDLPDEERGRVAIAFREMLLNAIEHGCSLDPSKRIRIEYVRARHMVVCRIDDPGPGFTLDEIQHAAISNPGADPMHHVALRAAQGMRPGGFGILLAQGLVDQLIYNEEGSGVLLVKYLDSPTEMPR